MQKRRNRAQLHLYNGRFSLEDELSILADHISVWNIVAEFYDKNFDIKTGPSAYPIRLAYGLFFFNTKTGLSDRDLIKQRSQNSVYQYFWGFHFYSDNNSCDVSLMSHFRNILPEDVVNRLNNLHFIKVVKESDSDDSDDENHGNPSDQPKDDNSK